MKFHFKKSNLFIVLIITAVIFTFNACSRPVRQSYDMITDETSADYEENISNEESSDTATDTETTVTETTQSTTTTKAVTTTTTHPKVKTIENGGLGKNADSADLKMDDSDKVNTIETVTTRAATKATTAATAAVTTTPSNNSDDNSSATTTTTTAAPVSNSYYLSVNNILQNPELPTGCEVTSLTIVLNYLGYNVDKCTMVDQYLPWTTEWDSINTHFIRNPRSVHGCGCNAPVIVNAANTYLNDNGGRYTAVNKTGSSPSQLYDMVKNGYPVMVWATIGMQDTYVSGSWTAQDTGEKITFMKREHCLVLTGYDKDAGTVTFCDPMVGIASYDMSVFETRYSQLGNQAVILQAQ